VQAPAAEIDPPGERGADGENRPHDRGADRPPMAGDALPRAVVRRPPRRRGRLRESLTGFSRRC
jgi:hypothetical protein